MIEEAINIPKVVNCHWFGGSDKLPPLTVYIGRPSPYGNSYSSTSGLYTKEECVALHRIDMYQRLVQDPSWLSVVHKDLGHHDLACWCKGTKRIIACHGDTYLHLLSEKNLTRQYDRSVVFYLMDDLRTVMSNLQNWITHSVPQEHFLTLDVHFGDVRLDVEHVVRYCREKKIDHDAVTFLLARLIVDLELAHGDTDVSMVAYRFDHVIWTVKRFIDGRTDRLYEPVVPGSKPTRKKEKDND